MNKIILILACLALFAQGYLDNKTEKELKRQILELKKDRWEFYAECEEAFKKCETKGTHETDTILDYSNL